MVARQTEKVFSLESSPFHVCFLLWLNSSICFSSFLFHYLFICLPVLDILFSASVLSYSLYLFISTIRLAQATALAFWNSEERQWNWTSVFFLPPNSSLEAEQHSRTYTTWPSFPDLPINWGFSSCWCRLNRANPGALGCSGSVFHWVQQKKKVKTGLQSGPAYRSRGTDQKMTLRVQTQPTKCCTQTCGCLFDQSQVRRTEGTNAIYCLPVILILGFIILTSSSSPDYITPYTTAQATVKIDPTRYTALSVFQCSSLLGRKDCCW